MMNSGGERIRRLRWYDWLSLFSPFAVWGFGVFVVKVSIVHPLEIVNVLISFGFGLPFFVLTVLLGAVVSRRIDRKLGSCGGES